MSHLWLVSLLTFCLLLNHDGVAEGEQSEEGVDLGVLQLHRFHQGMIMEFEAGVGQRVEFEVHRLCVLAREIREGSYHTCKRDEDEEANSYHQNQSHLCDFYSLTHVVINVACMKRSKDIKCTHLQTVSLFKNMTGNVINTITLP